MAINYNSLRSNVAYVINNLTGKKVIWANQNANTPDGDFISMKLSSFRFIGATDYQSKPSADELSSTQGDREFVLSLQAISQTGMDILLDLIDKLNLKSNLSLLTSKKLVYVEMDGDISDITVEINKNFETRATVDLLFRISKNYSSDTEDSTPIVESISIAGTVGADGDDDPLALDFTIEE